MNHGEPVQLEQDNASEVKARLGLRLFILYGLIYAGFVLLNTFSPQTMGEKIIFDLNLAVIYGFGLIVLAIIMGLIYNTICTRYEKRMNAEEANNDGL